MSKIVKWCSGTCGSGQICRELTYHTGHCKEPLSRRELVSELDDRDIEIGEQIVDLDDTLALYGVNMNEAEIRSIRASVSLLSNSRIDEIKTTLENTEDEKEIDLLRKLDAESARRLAADKLIEQKTASQNKPMTEQEELFSKFYHHEKILVKDMDITTLREHREELSKIAFEAKARLIASDDESRERNAKNKTGKEWTLSPTSDQISSDAINNIKQRSARLSKMDKVKRDLLAAGIDETTVNEMVRNLERKATDKDMKTITFKSPEVKIEVKQQQDTTPFNPSNLKF